MNWIKAYNISEKKYNVDVYQKCCEVQQASQEVVDIVYKKVCDKYTLEYLQNTEDISIQEINQFITSQLEENMNILKNELNGINVFSKELSFKILEECLNYLPNNKKGMQLVLKRLSLTRNKIIFQLKYFIKETISSFGEDINYYFEMMLRTNSELIDNEVDDEIEIDIEKGSRYKLKKIYCYKEMEKLALGNGYDYKWSNGSHRIYEHNTTNKIIVIPSHELGLGLSYKIQKQILNNAI